MHIENIPGGYHYSDNSSHFQAEKLWMVISFHI